MSWGYLTQVSHLILTESYRVHRIACLVESGLVLAVWQVGKGGHSSDLPGMGMQPRVILYGFGVVCF